MKDDQFSREALLAPVRHWTPTRKRLLVAGVGRRLISSAEAAAAHRISAEEFAEWRRVLRARGPRGLTAAAPVFLRRGTCGAAVSRS